jgi:hypothetical protein
MMRALALALLAGAGSASASTVVLVPNRTIYELSLAHTSAGGMIAARGRIVIEFRDVCDGWATTQRMLADMTDADGKVARDDFLVTAWESKTGREMRFDITNSVDGRLVERQRGRAKEEAEAAVRSSLQNPRCCDSHCRKGPNFRQGRPSIFFRPDWRCNLQPRRLSSRGATNPLSIFRRC